MKAVKLALIAVSLSSILAFASPGVSAAASIAASTPPAVVLVQDRKNPMLVSHNFKYDKGMLVPVESKAEDGIYVTIGQ